MYKPKQIITNTSDRIINDTIYVSNNTVYLNDIYKYYYGSWYIRVDDNWINLQGGTPTLEYSENLDSDIFEPVGDEE